MRETVIRTHKPYKYITCDSFAGLAEELFAVVKSDRLFVVYDKNTKKLFAKELREELCDFSFPRAKNAKISVVIKGLRKNSPKTARTELPLF